MDQLLFYILLFSGIRGVCLSVPRRHHFVNQSKTWDEAQKHCRAAFTDLASAERVEDLTDMRSELRQSHVGLVWIGLRKTGDHVWRWSQQDPGAWSLEETNFTSWGSGEPRNGVGPEDCAASTKGLWSSISCGNTRYFICYDEGRNEHDKYTLIRQKKIWRRAQEYCRQHHTDLASVRNQTENQMINQTAMDQAAWIGLFRDDWAWSDQTRSLFRFWSPGLPDNSEGNENCAATKPHRQMDWGDRRCDYRYPFFCYENKLVLIRENKTWREAVDYCERRHVELVLASSEEKQGWVREVARGASTAHVWMGLYFLCPLDLWFWTNRVTVWRDDWAAGNGTGRDECGHAGALQSGGEQKWVSRPEAERLNFICRTY